jgi:zinc protease
VQTALRSVAAAPRLGTTERATAEVLDMLVGNGWCSVFHRVLREKHGYGYHPSSAIVDHRLGAQLEMSVDVAAEVTGAAMAVLEEELDRLATTPVDDDLLEIARRGAVGALARRFDGQAFLAELLHDLAAAGLQPSYLQEHVSALHAVTADQVQGLAARMLRLDALSYVLVGDRTAIAGQQSSGLLDSVLC